jgi:protoheme IX farnesyltransferase
VTTVAVYAVLATGAAATTSATACSNWPFCAEWGTLSGGTLFVLGHQLLTGLAGILLVVALVGAIQSEVSRPVQLLLGAGTLLFVVQVVLGALLATGQVGVSSQLHLLVGGAIFATLLVALGWTLEDPSAEGQPLQPENIDSMAEPQDSSGDDQPGSAKASRDWKGTAAAYLELTKPRLMWLLCLLALAGVALATTTGARPTGVTVVATLAGGVLAIGASGTFNHVAERERDRQMDRTADRPVATDQIPRRNAVTFGVALLVLSMVVMVGLVNIVAALLTLVAVAYYSVVYTVVLKPNTSWNIAIGGGAGALPAVIGWAAVTGSVGVPALVLAGLVVVWTPAHFYNLAIVYRDDYARAGYPMYPVVSGVPAARQRIMTTLGMTLLVAVLLLAVTPLGMLFALSTVAVGAVFLGALVVQCRARTDAATLRTFHASNAYLGVILLAIVIEAVLVL